MKISTFTRLRKHGLRLLKNKYAKEEKFHLSVTDLKFLLFFPHRKVQKQAIKLLKSIDPPKYELLKSKNRIFYLTNQEHHEIREFIIFFLIDANFSFYYNAYRTIRKQKEQFRIPLIFSLVDKEGAIQQNTAKILHDIFPKDYPSPNAHEILKNLEIPQKKLLLNILSENFNRLDLPWDEKEDMVVKLGDLALVESIPLFHALIVDAQDEIRYNIAQALGKIRDNDAIELLYLLLIDNNQEIRENAAQSLGTLLPGMFGGKSPLEIIERLDPQIVLRSLQQTKSSFNLDRFWQRQGFDSQFIHQHFQSSAEQLIHQYLAIRSQSGNPRKLKSVMLLLVGCGASAIRLLDHFIQQKKFPASHHWLIDLKNQIQAQYSIQKPNGFQILL